MKEDIISYCRWEYKMSLVMGIIIIVFGVAFLLPLIIFGASKEPALWVFITYPVILLGVGIFLIHRCIYFKRKWNELREK